MASFDNLTPIEPWMFKSTLTDPWYPEAFARETESALTLALQQSLFHQPIPQSVLLNNDYCSGAVTVDTVSTITASGSGSGFGYGVTESGSVSGSDPETPGSEPGFKHREGGSSLGVMIGKSKGTKRKSRANKRATTTFIQADPANFRQMVQQVTGAQFGDGKLPEVTVVKPEPLRQPFVNKLQGLLPTLDTSAYLLDVQNINTRRVPVSGNFPARGHVTENGGGGVEFYSCSNFPTLESSI